MFGIDMLELFDFPEMILHAWIIREGCTPHTIASGRDLAVGRDRDDRHARAALGRAQHGRAVLREDDDRLGADGARDLARRERDRVGRRALGRRERPRGAAGIREH